MCLLEMLKYFKGKPKTHVPTNQLRALSDPMPFTASQRTFPEFCTGRITLPGQMKHKCGLRAAEGETGYVSTGEGREPVRSANSTTE